MEYNRTYWQAREGTKLNKFTKANETLTTVELTNAPDSVTIAGTEVTTDRLNNMESGIVGAVAGVNEIQGVVDFTSVLNTLTGLSQTSREWRGMTNRVNDVYACVRNGDIYKQTGGVGDFIALGQTSRYWYGMTTLGNDVYACVSIGDIYKQTNGTGDFIALGQETRSWSGMTTLGNDVYACVYNGDIYKQAGGTGDFIALGQTSISWSGMTTLGNDVYACVLDGGIYKQTGGIGNFITLGQTSRAWNGMITIGNDVYACVDGGDIYKQTGGTGDFIALGQESRNWRGVTALDSVLYACVFGGDIYTAPILTGNTFRASSSFTIPAMPDGARKRILNTHATNAITVTAYTGTTIEGQATMTLSAGHEVEIELIGTDWKKTGWNEKALLTYSAPVDCTSRVAEYTGDGIPLIPDNVAGRTYFQDEWATTDGFSATNGTISVSGGNLIFNKTSTATYNVYADKSLSFSAKVAYLKVTALQDIANFILYGVGGTTANIASTGSIKSGETRLVSGYDAGTYATLRLLANTSTTGQTGELAKVDVVYIGNGAYNTPALDRAGNGNSLTLNSVTPVNGKYGKEMSFNGSSSYAQASSPVIGTTGSISIRLKPSSLSANLRPFGNRRVGLAGGVAGFIYLGTGVFEFSVVKADGSIQAVSAGSVSISDFTSFTFSWDGVTIKTYRNGVLINSVAQLEAMTVPIDSLAIGRMGIYASDYFNGIISHFRYDSRIWTADDARAWSLNPSVYDSLSMSETPSAGDVMVWPNNGLLYKDFIITSPAAGGVASLSHGLTTTKVRSIDATLVNASGAVVPRGYLNADGTRNAKFDINLNSTSVYVVSDSTLAATLVGQPVYIRIGYTV